MKRFIEGADRGQSTLFPECLEDWIDENNPVQAIDVFVDELDVAELGFDKITPEVTGRPSYHPSVLLKLYIYGYLNRVQSSRRLKRSSARNAAANRAAALGGIGLRGIGSSRAVAAIGLCIRRLHPNGHSQNAHAYMPVRARFIIDLPLDNERGGRQRPV